MKLKTMVAGICILCVASAMAGDDTMKAELKKLQGTWVGAYTEQDGKKKEFKSEKTAFGDTDMTLIIEGDKIFMRMFKNDTGNNAMVPGIKGTFKIDPSKKPTTIDIVTAKREGDDGGQKVLGLYELEGDNLKIVYDFGQRPTEFKGAAGSKTAVFGFKKK